MERKSSVNEVHKVVQKDLSELHKILSKQLGQNNPFAKISIGNGYYLWSDNRCQWNQMIATDDFEQSIIKDALLKTKMQVANLIGSKTADSLFTTPDDSYIYYNDDEGEVKILVTGWGFKKPVRQIVGPDDGEIRKNTPVTLSFSYDGEKQPMYEFGILIPTQTKKFKTDETGCYHFNNLTKKELLIKDFVTGKEFQLVVEEGRTEYDFDVTIYTKLVLKATSDNNPIIGEQIKIQYYGMNYEAYTDATGSAVVQLPLHDKEQVIATLRDQTQTETILPDFNNIEFAFETPLAEVTTDIEISVMEDSKPVSGQPVTITHARNQYNGTTNERGLFTQQVVIDSSDSCSVAVPGYETQTKILQAITTNVFRFEKTTTPPELHKKFTPHILIAGDNGFIGNKYPISIEYNGEIRDYISDDNGLINLPEMEDGMIMKVTDGRNPTNTSEYELKEEQLEYIFQVPNEEPEENIKIKVMLRDTADKPIKCDQVSFVQESSNEVLATLDNNGDTYFDLNTFKVDTPISVSILGGTKGYEPFIFTLDRNEYEYLLQEKNTTSWLTTLWQILLVIVSIVSLYMLWAIFEGIFRDTFWGIYH